MDSLSPYSSKIIICSVKKKCCFFCEIKTQFIKTVQIKEKLQKYQTPSKTALLLFEVLIKVLFHPIYT